MVGAGSVITKPVKAFALMMGNPATQRGWVSEYGQKLLFTKEGKAICPESGDSYLLADEAVVKISI